MAFYTVFISAAVAMGLAVTTAASPVPQLARRCGGCGGIGYGGWGYGGWGIPFASSFTNAFNANNNFAHFNDDTLYVNNKDATVANNNVNNFNNANIVA